MVLNHLTFQFKQYISLSRCRINPSIRININWTFYHISCADVVPYLGKNDIVLSSICHRLYWITLKEILAYLT